jgi:hypothetical protein
LIAADEQAEVQPEERVEKPNAVPAKRRQAGAKRVTPAARERRRREAQLQVIGDILKNVEEKLTGKDAKATLGDYIKLMQLQKELDEDEQPREIKVMWVDSLAPTEHAGDEPGEVASSE